MTSADRSSSSLSRSPAEGSAHEASQVEPIVRDGTNLILALFAPDGLEPTEELRQEVSTVLAMIVSAVRESARLRQAADAASSRSLSEQKTEEDTRQSSASTAPDMGISAIPETDPRETWALESATQPNTEAGALDEASSVGAQKDLSSSAVEGRPADPLTDLRIREIRERLEKATDTADPKLRLNRYDHGGGRMFIDGEAGDRNLIADFYELPDREFYAHAYADVRYLVDQLAAARRAVPPPPAQENAMSSSAQKALRLAKAALLAVEWRGGNGLWSATCAWCGGYERHPAMDQDYYGTPGHKDDCPRQKALAEIDHALGGSQETP